MFIVFGVVMILFPLSAMITFNIVFLVIGPVILILVLAAEAAIQHNRRRYIQNGDAPGSSNSLWDHFWSWFIEFGWLKGFLSWAKFWIALIATVGLQVLLVYGYLKVNPFVSLACLRITITVLTVCRLPIQRLILRSFRSSLWHTSAWYSS